jgi:tight adherence protein C
MSSSSRAVLGLALAMLLSALAPTSAFADDTIRVRMTDVDASAFPEVRFSLSVVDGQDLPVASLGKDEIFVSEQGRPQAITVDPASRIAPIALALVIDTSGSMAGRPMADAKAATALLARNLGADDSGAVITFNTEAQVRQSLTSEKENLLRAIESAQAGGNTAIFDAVASAMDVLSGVPAQTRRAIVLVTDGVDNSSAAGLDVVTARMTRQGYPLYVVGLGAALDRRVLQALADSSKDGRVFLAPSSADLTSIYAGLSQRIVTQYVVSYTSDTRDSPDLSTLTVTVQIQKAGAVRGSASATFSVPAGRGVVKRVTPSEPATQTKPVTLTPARAAEGPYSAEIVGLLGSATMLSLLLWLFAVVSTRAMHQRERRRVGTLVESPLVEGTRARLAFSKRVVIPALISVSRPMSRLVGGFMSESIRRRLMHAGDPLDLGPAEFLGLQICLGLIAAAISAGISLIALGPEPFWIALIALGGLLIGIVAPAIPLDRAARERKRKILLALPSALDMLALSARAGMTFDGAVAQVVHRWDGPLIDELRRMLSELRIGRDRRDALRDMAARTGVQEVVRFANAIIQADMLGVPVSKVLRDQALEMRVRRRQRAEEAARKAPIKMLFPMVGLIFPALFVAILGPAVPRLLDIFRATN